MKNVANEKVLSPISFGGYWFENKKCCVDETRSRISRYKRGQKLSESDTKFFTSLFTMHHDYLEKIGCGIKFLRFDRNKEYGNNCIIIVRRDDTEVDISWATALQPPRVKHDIQTGFRAAVEHDVNMFKKIMIERGARCWLTGEKLTYENCRATYSTDLTFNELLDEFLDIIDIDIHEVSLVQPRRRKLRKQPVLMLQNPTLKRMWFVYHREMAQIVLVSTKDDLKTSNRSMADLIIQINKARLNDG